MNQCKVKIGSAYDPRKAPRIAGDSYRLQVMLIEPSRMSHAERMDRFIFRICMVILAVLALVFLLSVA
jgi:type IV secretory pathway component VirB8